MQKKLVSYSLLVAVILVSIAACKNKCPEGYVCVDDACLCPEDKFEGKGMCRELKPNEYYASFNDCPCEDTVFFEVLEKTPELMRVQLDLGWGYEQLTCGIIALPEGDSIYTEANTTFTSRLACPIDGRQTSTQIFGKFIENDSKIQVTLKYMASPLFEDELGRCDFILRQ